MRCYRCKLILRCLFLTATAPSLAFAQERGPASTYEESNIQAGLVTAPPSHASSAEVEWRHPIAVALSRDDHWLYVACRRSASLAILDLRGPDESPVAIHELGGRPEAMTMLPNGELVIADGQRDRIFLLGLNGERMTRKREMEVGRDPRQLAASHRSSIFWVSLRGDRAVVAIDASTGEAIYRCPLPFAPHCLALDSQEQWLLASDAFRGQVAAIDVRAGRILATHTFPGTNIRGLAFEPDASHFLMVHQIVSERSVIEREQVRWGAFITNNVRRVPIDVFLADTANATKRSELQFIGDFGKGAGDPTRLLAPVENVVAVCLSGVHQIGLDTAWPLRFTRIPVGRRPIDLAINSQGSTVYVANQFDDSISVVDVADRSVIRTLSLGRLPIATSEMRGEVLFHDATLSLDNWYSCQSCHTDGHTNGVNADTFGDGGMGAPKNTPSLLGVAQTGPWSWTGRFETLEDQIASSIEHTMQSPRTSSSVTSDLAAYLATLEPNGRANHDMDRTLVDLGRKVFVRRGCTQCHAGETLTAKVVFDVGIHDGPGGNSRFNPPSLRGVANSAPYFHDGRAPSLEDVFLEFRHPAGDSNDESDLVALIAYLKSL